MFEINKNTNLVTLSAYKPNTQLGLAIVNTTTN